MPKGYKNPTNHSFLVISEADDIHFFEVAGSLYFFDIDETCYMWSPEKTWWVETKSFFYWDSFYEGVHPGDTVTSDEAKERYPGSVPLMILTNKPRQAKREEIWRQLVAASTDTQIYEVPANLPRGFEFTDVDKGRAFAHALNAKEHAVGKVLLDIGPKYVGFVWCSGVDATNRLPQNSKRFESKNEAQAWVIEEIKKIEQASEAEAKGLMHNEEGEGE